MGFSGLLVCSRAMANSRSISFTSSVVNRCSRVTLSSCCIVLTRLATFDGRLGCSACSSTSIKDGAADIRVTLVTVVPDEGLPDCPLLELSSNGGDREPGTDAGLGGADDVRCGQETRVSGRLSVISRKASVLLDRRWESKLCLRSGAWLLSSCGSDIADATANRDSSSEKTTLGRVARLRRGMPPGIESRRVGESRGDNGDRCVSAIWRFSAESGLLRCEFKFRGGGAANIDLPFVGTDFRMGVAGKVDSYGFSSSSSA